MVAAAVRTHARISQKIMDYFANISFFSATNEFALSR